MTGLLIYEAYWYPDDEVVKSLKLDDNGENKNQWMYEGGDNLSKTVFSITRTYNPDNNSLTEEIKTTDGNFQIITTHPEDPAKGLDFLLNIGEESLSISTKTGGPMEVDYRGYAEDLDAETLFNSPQTRILQYKRDPLEFLVITPYYIQKHYEDGDNKRYLVFSIRLNEFPFANSLLLELNNSTDQECYRISMSLKQFAYTLDTYTKNGKSQNRRRRKPPFKY